MKDDLLADLLDVSVDTIDRVRGALSEVGWPTRYELIIKALEATSNPVSAAILSRLLWKELSDAYVPIVLLKLRTPEFLLQRADLIRSLKNFDCSVALTELLEILESHHYEQAYTAYQVLTTADFTLSTHEKPVLEQRISSIGSLAFCRDDEIVEVVSDIKDNLCLE